MKLLKKIEKGRMIHLEDDLVEPGTMYPCTNGKTLLLCLHKEENDAYFVDVTNQFNNRSYISKIKVIEQIAARVQKEKQAGRL